MPKDIKRNNIMNIKVRNFFSDLLFDYSDRNSLSLRNKIIDKIDDFLTSMFIFEAIAKILAMGFVIHKYSYLRYGWNIVDLIIVAAG